MNKILASLLFAGLSASAVSAQHVLFGSANPCVTENTCLGSDWTRLARASPSESIELVFAVRAVNQLELERIVYDVSTPGSPSYGKHLTFEEVGQLTVDRSDTEAIESYLRNNGITSFQTLPNGDFIRASVTVGQAEELLNTQFHHYRSRRANRAIIRTEIYSLPIELHQYVDLVGNTVQFPPTHARTSVVTHHAPSAVGATGTVSPQLLSQVYNIDSNTCATASSTMSVFEGLSQSYSSSDLTSFQQKFNIPAQQVAKIIGPNSGGSCRSNPNNCAEAGLDVQWIIAVAQGCPLTFWSIGGNGDIFLEWVLAVAGTSSPPLVHSMSYGSIESENVPSDMTRFNTELAKLAARGLTVLIASGDDGVANYIARSDRSKCGFNPSFPATSPYATAVGATQGPENGQTEIVCSSKTNGLITSGGGFSSYFGRPSYQSSAVAGYFQQNVPFPPSNQYNNTGRGYPDVALVGHNYVEADGGQFFDVSGTSASTPVFAGMIALINAARLSSGGSPVGFLNPTLYQAGSSSNVFHDITQGENNCCAGTGSQIVCCQYGFTAAPGWDPTTGFGSVNFVNLKSLF